MQFVEPALTIFVFSRLGIHDFLIALELILPGVLEFTHLIIPSLFSLF